jgi:hypothetical protein
MLFTLKEFNEILKTSLGSKVNYEWYVDFLNVFCVLNGVRNGAHLDTCTDSKVISRLLTGLECFPLIMSNKRWETTIWDSTKVTETQVKNSWAFQGDFSKKGDTEYWKNTGILLGNDKGYPTYTTDPEKRGLWSLNLTLNVGQHVQHSSRYISMMGGCYDRTKADDLASVEVIQKFLQGLVGIALFHPDRMIFLEKVELVCRT